MNLEKNKPTKIFLIGQSGSGKTTLGKKLSAKLKFDFLDTDEFITNEFASSISDGDDFIQITSPLSCIISKESFISGNPPPVATTIFTLFFNESSIFFSSFLKNNSPLDLNISEIEKRLINSNRGHRPLLFNNELSLIENLETQLEKRYDVYSKADLIIVNDNIDEAETIEMILEELKNYE